MSKKFLPGWRGPTARQGFAKLGARSVVAATLRAVQLLGRQFVLGQTMAEAMQEATQRPAQDANLRYSYDMLGEGARTDADALVPQASYQDAIASIAASADTCGL
jgi:RHH-type proline utilization regulon transcriptional repressor/proline dehydrogenase/delta 1-pyrroline-5-carboxylate dehydrogenase